MLMSGGEKRGETQKRERKVGGKIDRDIPIKVKKIPDTLRSKYP